MKKGEQEIYNEELCHRQPITSNLGTGTLPLEKTNVFLFFMWYFYIGKAKRVKQKTSHKKKERERKIRDS